MEPEVIYRGGMPRVDASGPGPTLALWRVVTALDIWGGGPEPRNPVAGIAVGGCVEAIGTGREGAFRRSAHAHTTGDWRGWICVRSRRPERLVTATGRPSRLLIHEVAHIATRTGHDARWRAMVARLGAPSEAQRTRRRSTSD